MLQKHKVLPQVYDTDDIKEENSSACACNYKLSIVSTPHLTTRHTTQNIENTTLYRTSQHTAYSAPRTSLRTLHFTLKHTTPAHASH